MIMHRTRREFLADVGGGKLIAGVVPALAADLGLGTAFGDDLPEALTFWSMPAVSKATHRARSSTCGSTRSARRARRTPRSITL
jgi:hypothetical protein